jgi:hypothetical protein
MDANPIDTVVLAFLKQINRSLSHAAGIADAAIILADRGQLKAAVELVMGIEDQTHLSDRLLQGILLIRTELQNERID